MDKLFERLNIKPKDNTIYKSENNCIIEIATGEVIFDPDSH